MYHSNLINHDCVILVQRKNQNVMTTNKVWITAKENLAI